MGAIKSLPCSSPRSSDTAVAGTVLTGPQHTLVPPSPGLKRFEAENHTNASAVRKIKARTGAGVHKGTRSNRDVFRFLDLPGGTYWAS